MELFYFNTIDDLAEKFWEYVDWKESEFVFLCGEEPPSYEEVCGLGEWVVFDTWRVNDVNYGGCYGVLLLKKPYYLSRQLGFFKDDVMYDLGGAEFDESSVNFEGIPQIKAYMIGYNQGIERAASIIANHFTWDD